MGYKGETFRIGLERGGLVGTKNYDALQPTDMIAGTGNINTHLGTRKKRGGTAHLYESAFTDTPQVMGIYDFTLISETQFIIAALKNGYVYKDDTNTIDTGMSTTNFFDFETFNNTLYICDGNTIPQTWDGAAGTTSNLANVPTDWTGTSYPQVIIKHGRGNAEQLWAFGCTLNKNTIYASQNDTDNFGDANVQTFHIETGDGHGIVAGIEFGDRLILFGKTKTYIVDDTDSDRANWGYTTAQWYGGAANFRLVCETPNDVIAMMEDGEIYSVTTAEQYGDYKQASLTRPADIHKWIADNLDLTDIDKFHMVYDPAIRAVRIFGVQVSASVVSQCLLYYIDREPREAWMVHNNLQYASGFDASASAVIRAAQGDWKIYTGDYGGNIWKLEEEDKNDNSNQFWAGFKTPPLHFDNERIYKKFRRGFAIMQAMGDYSLYLVPEIDGLPLDIQSLLMDGSGAVLDSFTLDTDSIGGVQYIDRDFDIGDKGKRLALTFYNGMLDEDFDVSTILIDHKNLGRAPTT